jgi:hypothetical protein
VSPSQVLDRDIHVQVQTALVRLLVPQPQVLAQLVDGLVAVAKLELCHLDWQYRAGAGCDSQELGGTLAKTA